MRVFVHPANQAARPRIATRTALPRNSVLQLQQVLGNRAVQRLLSARTGRLMLQTSPRTSLGLRIEWNDRVIVPVRMAADALAMGPAGFQTAIDSLPHGETLDGLIARCPADMRQGLGFIKSRILNTQRMLVGAAMGRDNAINMAVNFSDSGLPRSLAIAQQVLRSRHGLDATDVNKLRRFIAALSNAIDRLRRPSDPWRLESAVSTLGPVSITVYDSASGDTARRLEECDQYFLSAHTLLIGANGDAPQQAETFRVFLLSDVRDLQGIFGQFPVPATPRGNALAESEPEGTGSSGTA
jgi:hypothetical protein